MNVFITGGTRGIGKSLVESFCKDNHNVFFCYEKSEENAFLIEKEMENQGFFAKGLKIDVSVLKEVSSAVTDVINRYGMIDVLINNAGISLTKLFQDVTEEEWDRVFDVNVKGIYHFTKAVMPGMIAAKNGRIINISSIWGVTGASCEAVYSASKAAVIGLTKALAKELGPSGITVNCIAPGVIDTEMNRNLSAEDIDVLKNETPLMRIGTGEDIASLALFLASEKASFLTGQVIQADGGFAI